MTTNNFIVGSLADKAFEAYGMNQEQQKWQWEVTPDMLNENNLGF